MAAKLSIGQLAIGSLLLSAVLLANEASADRLATIARVKESVVAVGTFQRTRAPPFQFLGTGFVVGDGTLVATNSHVIPQMLDPANIETLAILLPASTKDGHDQVQMRVAERSITDAEFDLALLKIKGPPLPAVKIKDSNEVSEGQDILFTGFPIGSILGPYPVTHRGIISAITPIAIAQPVSGALDAKEVRRLRRGPLPVFQLDATAYPGNSGSPVYDPDSGEVLGIINMVLVKGLKESALTAPTGISYAVPSIHLKDLLEEIH